MIKYVRPILSLLIIILLASCASDQPGDNIQDHRLMTRWAEQVDPDNVLPEYPRPQMVRGDWMNLNGLWEYAIIPAEDNKPSKWDGSILVPYPVESALSGVGKAVGQDNKLWYRRTFKLPGKTDDLVILLNFGAVDWATTVWVNGQEVGQHKGGYDAFSFDISGALTDSGEQEIVVSVWDPVDEGTQPRGKQVNDPRGIWYTSVTGIWQTVWLEPLKEIYIQNLKIIPDIDEEQLILKTGLSKPGTGHKLVAELRAGNMPVSRSESGEEFIVLQVPEPHLWTPDDPFLYDLILTLFDRNGEVTDEVTSYAGMRKISLGRDEEGLTRIMLNNEFLFQFGPLDQGWWPDGLYTAPADEALRYDIETTKKLGFNMARKHVKIEPARWYYWCDKLGLLVWQDMPSGDEYIDVNDPDLKRSEESDKQFRHELKRLIDGYFNHPSIVMWVPFNEGWGQYATGEIVKYIKKLDPTRLVNPSSGWADRKVGDIQDIHAYPGPAMPEPEGNRAIVLGEFGGLGLPVEGHTWQDKDNWGYRSFESTEELLVAYTGLIRDLMPMIDKGLSAAVYTQTSDVEIEVNGLMTYDRAVIKFDHEKISLINKGFLPPVFESESDIFLESLLVEIKNSLQEGVLRFTLDGSDPHQNSPQYSRPVLVKETTTFKARTYWFDGTFSGVSSYTAKQVELQAADPGVPEKGISFKYYENDEEDSEWFQLPDFSELEPKETGIAEQCDLELAEREFGFGFIFEGWVKIPDDGIYTFYPASDDGSKLYINDQLLVDNDREHGIVEKAGNIALASGFHKFRLEFFQNFGGKGLYVMFEGPGIEKQIMPAEMLWH